MQKHFVTFYSPGTLFHEQTSREIDSWDIETAKGMAHEIRERHCAIPFAFRFSTRARTEEELDSSEVAQSCWYFLGGTLRTIEEVREKNDPEEQILLSNMESNDYQRVIENRNSWKVTVPFGEEDVLLDWHPTL